MDSFFFLFRKFFFSVEDQENYIYIYMGDTENYTCLTSTASTDEPKIVELGHLILHHRGGISQLRAAILVVPCTHCHQGPVTDLAQGYHLERYRKRLVRPPMRR